MWKPIVDESLNTLVETYLQAKENKPSFIVLGMVASYLQKNSTREALDAFKSNLTNLADLVKSLNYDTKYPNANKRIYKLDKSTTRAQHNHQQSAGQQAQTNSGESQTVATSIYWMLQDPIDEVKCFVNRTVQPDIMTNRQIDLYNRAAINLL